jgi:hypothetical protein
MFPRVGSCTLTVVLALVPSLAQAQADNPWAELDEHVSAATWRSGLAAAERIEAEAAAVGDVRRAAEALLWQVRFQEKLEPARAFERAWLALRPADPIVATWIDLIALERLGAGSRSSRRHTAAVGIDRPIAEWSTGDFQQAAQELIDRIELRRHRLFDLPAGLAAPGIAAGDIDEIEAPTAWDLVVRVLGGWQSRLEPLDEAAAVAVLEGARVADFEGPSAARRLLELNEWHERAGRPEAAVATRLLALGWTYARGEVVAATERLLDRTLEGEAVAWARFRQARRVLDLGQPGTYSRALRHAERGAAAARSEAIRDANLALVAHITEPELRARSFRHDLPDRPSIRLETRNLDEFELRAWRVAADTSSWSRCTVLPGGAVDHTAVFEVDRSQPLEDPHGWRTTVVTPGLGLGLWTVELRPPGAETGRRLVGCLRVTELFARVVEHPSYFEVEVSAARDGQPVEAAEVWLENGAAPLGLTDRQGLLRLPESLKLESDDILVARHGTDSLSFAKGSTSWRSSSQWEDLRIATDRAVYRPGETVQLKIFGLEHDVDGQERPRGRGGVELALLDPRREERWRGTVEIGERGTGTASIVIPSDGALGHWSFFRGSPDAARKAWPLPRVGTGFLVEEYKLPTFELDLGLDPAFWKGSGGTLRIRGSARSLVGTSLAGAAVRWHATVSASGDVRDWVQRSGEAEVEADGEFSFTLADLPQPGPEVDLAYWIQAHVSAVDGERRDAGLWFWRGAAASRVIADDAVVIVRESDRARIPLQRIDGFSRPLAGRVPWQLHTLQAPPAAASFPSEAEGAWRSDARPALESPLGDWVEGLRSDWPADRLIERGQVSARGEEARAQLALPLLSAGVYRLSLGECRNRSEWGCSVGIVVLPTTRPFELPVPLAVAMPDAVPAGGVADIAVYCAGGGSAQVVLGRDAGEGERWQVPCGRTTELRVPIHERDRLPAVGLSVVRIVDGQPLVFSGYVGVDPAERRLAVELEHPDPVEPGAVVEVRGRVRGPDAEAADAEVLVLAYDRGFDVGFGPHQLPPATASGSRSGAPWLSTPIGRMSQLGARMDRLPEPRREPEVWRLPDPLIFRFGHRAWYPGSGSAEDPAVLEEELVVNAPGVEGISDHSTAASTISYEAVRPEARPEGPPPLEARPPRVPPPPTALWLPAVLTDADGRVAVDVTAPDAVGEWTLALHAFDRRARIGEARSRLLTRLPLQVRLAPPRVLRSGDRVELPVIVDNRGAGRRERIDVTLEVQLRGADGSSTPLLREARRLRVPRGESAALWFAVEVPPGEGEIALQATVAGRRHRDAEARTVPWISSRLALAEGRSDFVDSGSPRELVFDLPAGSFDRELDLAVWSEPLEPVIEQLRTLAAELWECSDTQIERAAAMALLLDLARRSPALEAAIREAEQTDDDRDAVALDRMPAAIDGILNQLQARVTSGGLISWWPQSPPSVWLTAAVLEHLHTVALVAPDRSRALARRLMAGIQGYVESPNFRPGDALDLRLAAGLSPWLRGEALGDDVDGIFDRLEGAWQRGSIRRMAASAWIFAQIDRTSTGAAALRSLADAAVIDGAGAWSWSPEPRTWQWAPEVASTQAAVLLGTLELSTRGADVPVEAVEGAGRWLLRDAAAGSAGSREAILARARALISWIAEPGARADVEVAAGVGTAAVELQPGGRGRAVARVALDELEGTGERVVARFEVAEQEREARALVAARLSWQTDEAPLGGGGSDLTVERRVYRLGADGLWRPLATDAIVELGETIQVELVVRAALPLALVEIEDPRPAGFEPSGVLSGFRWIDGRCVWFEIRDQGARLFIEQLPAGEHRLTHVIVARHPGAFLAPPARIEARLAPEISGYSAGGTFRVGEAPSPATIPSGHPSRPEERHR